jgi:hypothetical protein
LPQVHQLEATSRDTSHLKLARISVKCNTLYNVPAQDGEDDELVNLMDVDVDPE